MLIPGDYDHCCERGKRWQKKSNMLGRRFEHIGSGSQTTFLATGVQVCEPVRSPVWVILDVFPVPAARPLIPVSDRQKSKWRSAATYHEQNGTIANLITDLPSPSSRD